MRPKARVFYCFVPSTIRKNKRFPHGREKLTSAFQQPGVFQFTTAIRAFSNIKRNNVQCLVESVICNSACMPRGLFGR